jgi:hypothetical protein
LLELAFSNPPSTNNEPSTMMYTLILSGAALVFYPAPKKLNLGRINVNLPEMLSNCAVKQKKGLHFILASILIWTAVFLVHLT